MKKILLAEDDYDLGISLKQFLSLNKFDVVWGKNGEEALELFKSNRFDICVIDVMMPKMDGFTLAKKINTKNPEIPFIFLTARKTKEDKIKGLKIGADDFITKPFDVEELVLRLNNIIKRTKQQNKLVIDSVENKHIKIGQYMFIPKNQELKSNSKTFKLTEKEVQLIYFLYTHQNKLIHREDILNKVWGKSDFFSGRSMDVFISRIRKYFIEDNNINIKSVRGIGLEFNLKASK